MPKYKFKIGFASIVPVVVLAILVTVGGTAFVAQAAVPGDVLYGIKNVTENVRLGLAFNEERRARLHLAIAEEKLNEIEQLQERYRGMSEKRWQQAIDRAEVNRERALMRLEAVQEKGQDVQVLIERLNQNFEHQQEVLGRVFEEVPEEARPAIERAMEEALQKRQQMIERMEKQRLREQKERDESEAINRSEERPQTREREKNEQVRPQEQTRPTNERGR